MTMKTNAKKAGRAMPMQPATTVSKPEIHTPRARNKARVEDTPPRPSKVGMLVRMMRAKHGAPLEQLSKATGWQNHSVRGAISGNLKKKLGLKVASAKVDGVRVYRIVK